MSKFTNAIGSIFSKPKIPSTSTAPLPDPGAFASKLKARRETRKDKEKRGGRDSTIKSPNYTSTNRGGTG